MATKKTKNNTKKKKETKNDSKKSYGFTFSEFFLGPNRDPNTKVHVIDISLRSIFLILVTIASIYITYAMRNVILMLFLGFIFASAFLPSVNSLKKRGLSTGWAIALVYFLVFLIITLLLSLVFVPLVDQLQDLPTYLESFTNRSTEILENIARSLNFAGSNDDAAINELVLNFENRILEFLPSGSENIDSIFKAFSSLGGSLSILGFSLVLSIYIVYDHDAFLNLLLVRVMDKEKKEFVESRVKELEKKLGGWLRGQGTVCLVVFFMAYILLAATSMPLALPLAVLTGLMVAVPTIGPFISGIPIVLLAFLVEGVPTGIIVTLGYAIIQQTENSILVPKIMGSVVGVKPIIVYVGVLGGLELGGIVGALITVPVLVMFKIAYDSFVGYRNITAKTS